MELAIGKFRAQLISLDAALRQVLTGLFGRKLPPDRLLNDFFRANRRCGSRDRRLIAAAVYAVCRYWGWLRRLPDESLLSGIERGENLFSRREMMTLVCGALFIAAEETECCRALCRELEIGEFRTGATPLERAGIFASGTGRKIAFSLNDLVPGFALEAMDERLPREKVLETLTRRPPMWLRLREARRAGVLAALHGAEIPFGESDFLPTALRAMPSKSNLFTLESFRRGDFEVQDLASQAIGRVAAAKPGERWFDVCAGAGGKTLLLAEMMQNRGTIQASDIRQNALDALKLRARRAGFSNIFTKVHPGGAWKGRHPFDGVLIDAPCSGSGVWRRNAGCQWQLAADDISRYAVRQSEILERFASAVKPGGVLVYSTCSLFYAENDSQIARFLRHHPEFELESFAHPLTGETLPGTMTVAGENFDCDWMFASRMRRKA